MEPPPFEISEAPKGSSFTMITLKDLVASQEAGRKQLDEMLRFLKIKIEFEDRLALELSRAVKIPLDEITPPRNTTLNASLWTLRSYTDTRKTDQTLFAIAFEKQVRHPLERAEAKLRSDTVQLKLEATRAIKTAAQAEMRLKRARAALTSFPEAMLPSKRSMLSRRRLQSEGFLTPRVDKYAAAKATAHSAKREALSAIEARDKAMEEAAAATRALEKDRGKQMKLALERFVNLERQNLAARSAALESLSQSVKSIDIEGDICRVCSHLKSQQPTPASRFAPQPVTVEVASMTQTTGYAKALALLDWDWKRMKKAVDDAAAEEVNASSISAVPSTAGVPSMSSFENINYENSDTKSPLRSSTNFAPEGLHYVGGVLPPVPSPDDGRDRDDDLVLSEENHMTSESDQLRLAPTTALVKDLLFGGGGEEKLLNGQIQTYPVMPFQAITSQLLARCASEPGRSEMLQALNEVRTGEVCVQGDPGRFQAVVELFMGCLTICDDQMDVKHAKQFMILSDTVYTETMTPPTYVQREVCDHDIWSRRWFWEDVLLTGVTEQFDMSPQECPWEDLTPEQLHDEVLRVHNTVFAQLGAIVSNMIRFGRTSADIRKFLAKMCARSQLDEDMVLELNKMLEAGLRAPSRRDSELPQLPDSSEVLSAAKATLEDFGDDIRESSPARMSRVEDFSRLLAGASILEDTEDDDESEDGSSLATQGTPIENRRTSNLSAASSFSDSPSVGRSVSSQSETPDTLPP